MDFKKEEPLKLKDTRGGRDGALNRLWTPLTRVSRRNSFTFQHGIKTNESADRYLAIGPSSSKYIHSTFI